MIQSKIKNKKEKEKFIEGLKRTDIDTLIKNILYDFKGYKVKSEKNIISKEYITLLFEYSLRSTYTFLNYDLFLLKYVS